MERDEGPTLFEAFYELCAELGVSEDASSWADFFDVVPANARRYLCGSLRPRPERVQIWCDKIRERFGHHIVVELPPNVDLAFLVFHAPQEGQRRVPCRMRRADA